jgi:hypothetical protein
MRHDAQDNINKSWLDYFLGGIGSKAIIIGLLVWAGIRVGKSAYRGESVIDIIGTTALSVVLAMLLYLFVKIYNSRKR